MPQMKPMYWVPLLIYFFITYIITLMLTHYISDKINSLQSHPSTTPIPKNYWPKWMFKW
uniref:ATP synthase F0 subunit 8 n=1 Tax=Trybliographa sp. ZJUH 20220008 TaxID=2943454 RepID=A0A9E8JY29_9HYME|nr:ATP synthase F0 subunit 8 [Trybliographa sp. ZJUH 20220008]